MAKYPYENIELTNLKGERWKDIPGLEMYFRISNYGRVKRLRYELEYSDGRLYIKPEKIIKPVLMKISNRFIGDHTHFLRVTVTLFKQKYNFSLARLVYNSFKKTIEPNDGSVVILTKDGDGLNIIPSNLMIASLRIKQKRIFNLNRREPLIVDIKARRLGIEKSRLTNNKQVTQYNMLGRKIRTFSSIAVAAKSTGISHSHISNRARGYEYTAGGFIWKFGNAPKINITQMIGAIAERRRKNKETFGKKVTQYKLNGSRVASYATINDASKVTGIKHSEISRVMRKIRFSAGGFYWEKGEGPGFVDLSGYEYGEVLRAKNRSRSVRQYSKAGKPLLRFESIKKAAEQVGVNSSTIFGALTGKQQTAGGYRWKYL